MNIQNMFFKATVEHWYEIIRSHVNDGIPCCNTFIFWQRVTFWLSNLDKSNVGISNYMPIILWIIQNCHANISQICNIHNHTFLSTFKQKVREGKLCRYYKSSLKMFMIKHFQPCTDSIDYTKKNHWKKHVLLKRIVKIKLTWHWVKYFIQIDRYVKAPG